MASPVAITKRAEGRESIARDAMGTLASVVDDQMRLLTAQRDILTRVEQLLIALVQAQLDNGGQKATGSTVMTFARHEDHPTPRTER